MAALVTQRIREVFGLEAGNALAVAKCESGLNPLAHNGNASTGDDSWGVFQINRYGSLAAVRPSAGLLTQAEYNIRYAHAMWERQGWYGPWGCARKLNIR